MRVTYHCLPCNKEFIDIQMAKKHNDSTGHELMERRRQAEAFDAIDKKINACIGRYQAHEKRD